MAIHSNRMRSRGFSLIEVMIAVVVLSFGLLALAALQGALFKASAEAKAQSVALGLAQEKLEYFRGFRLMSEYQGITDGSDAAAISVGGVNYNRAWVVTRCAYPTAGGNFNCSVADTGALSTTNFAANNEFKRIQVNVTWTDAQNQSQRVSLEDAVAALDPADSARLGKLTSGARPRGPEVRIYNPAMQQEGVIPIAVGNGSDTAATNPKPLINGSNVIETRFDVLTYNQQSGNTAVAQSRVQTSVIGCSCSYDNKASGGMRPTFWDGARYSQPETAAAVIPSYAPIAGENPVATTQSDLCTICCRDHHDPVGLPSDSAKFDPRNAAHKDGHYKVTNVGNTPGLSGLVTGTGTYTESCRVLRVDGLFRVASDTYEEYQNFLATRNDSSTAPYLPTTAATTNYQNFVKAYLDARVVTNNTQSQWNDVLSQSAAGTVTALQAANSIYTTQPVAIPYQPNDAPKWLHLRGLYVDFLEDKALQAIEDARADCRHVNSDGTTSTPTTTDLEGCVLPILPFTSINTTELGIYAPLASASPPASITVANNNFATSLGSKQPVRGKVTRNAGAAAGTVNATATMLRSNSGLTAWTPVIDKVTYIDPEDELPSVPQRWIATQPYDIQGSGGGTGGGERFTANLYVGTAATAYPFASNITTPYINNFIANLTCTTSGVNPYTCASTSALGVLQTLIIGNYNYQYASTSSAVSTLQCTDGAGGTMYYSQSGRSTYPTKVCRNYAVSAVQLNGVAVTGLFTAANDGAKAETTTLSPILINNNDVVNVIFGTPVDTVQTATCSFSCTQRNNDGSCKLNKTTFLVTSPECP